ncbi:sulfite exporter TauE/SafE family protein [Rhodococcus sp. ABRD24]|uniref:sulfite exporter TauE/SafE family protein n=1 Tax=Rhodococcus sp. ABRD24 TaxID=2507582 RepID=UPI00103A69F5|nr:sulfite exporter TauE/SafE family protein [Rhodococcus sp. ABRD24]QBJ96753.1 sulfite exporter TauE/SafE family protein [Rhodococcus sp. ABRD24]
MLELALIVLVFIGAVTQRLAGLGFSMLVSPFLVLLIGPQQGVLVVNALASIAALVVAVRVWRDIDWHLLRWLMPPAVVTALLGAEFSARSSNSALLVVIGSVSVVALAGSILVKYLDVRASGRAATVVAGAAAGITNSTAGMGGPPITAYAILTDWPHRSFVATTQPLFLVLGSVSFCAKLAILPAGAPAWPVWMWCATASTLLAGTTIGDLLAQRFTPSTIRIFVVTVALAGAASVLREGLFT